MNNSAGNVVPGNNLGVVVIGRNEGLRLYRCLQSVLNSSRSVVYVDSGSTDNSVALARELAVEVVPLDMSRPFTAARARNTGLARLCQLAPEIRLVQFVDGDCEVQPAWIDIAQRFLAVNEDVACVCGRLRERNPDFSIYNRLCDDEWAHPAGQVDAVGGIAMMRIPVVLEIGGYREDLVAGEEPELCGRLRARGWRIWRLADEMALHDAAMLRFDQWWKRTRRTGFGYANAWRLASPGQDRKAALVRLLRPWLWAFALPLSTVVAALLWGPAAALLLLLYPAQVWRTAANLRGSAQAPTLRAVFLMLGKFAEFVGQWQYFIDSKTPRLKKSSFDYKS